MIERRSGSLTTGWTEAFHPGSGLHGHPPSKGKCAVPDARHEPWRVKSPGTDWSDSRASGMKEREISTCSATQRDANEANQCLESLSAQTRRQSKAVRSVARRWNDSQCLRNFWLDLFDELAQFQQGTGKDCTGRPVQSDVAAPDRGKDLNRQIDQL